MILAGRLNEPSLQLLFSKAQDFFAYQWSNALRGLWSVLIDAMSWGLPSDTSISWLRRTLGKLSPRNWRENTSQSWHRPPELASALDKLLSGKKPFDCGLQAERTRDSMHVY